MTTSNKELLSIIADLEAEFSKPTKAKRVAKREPTDADIRKARNKAFHDSLVPPDPLAGASAIARSLTNQPGWIAVARIAYIVQEHCRFCASSVEYIGNEFVLFENKRLRARQFSAELLTHDQHGEPLAWRTETTLHEVDYCAKCLRLSSKVDDLLAACEINGNAQQLDLHLQPLPQAEVIEARRAAVNYPGDIVI